jgi:hypothetical protein
MRQKLLDSVYRYATLSVCGICLAEHVIDYSGMVLEHHGSCELCGERSHFTFHLILASSKRQKIWEESKVESVLG